jgi:branched-chain amino acid transport system ATP-binding protein
MLKLKSIQTFYGNIQALKNVSMEISKGEIVTLIGANGAGKTTTLMSISGIVPPRTGEICFEEKKINGLSPNKIVDLGICQVPEGRRIFPYLTVLENLDMGAYLRKDTSAVKQDMDYIFELFPILAERRHQAGGTLSGGEQQMLAIARALMADPTLLVLDEPSMGLAPLVVSEIFKTISQLRDDQKTTIFLVEQNARTALKYADRGYVIETGKIMLEGRSDDLLNNREVQRAYLGRQKQPIWE